MRIILTSLLYVGVVFIPQSLHIKTYRSTGQSVCEAKAQSRFAFEIIGAPNKTWGYDILQDNKLLIHQPNRPGLPGTDGFKTKQGAIKVAQLVIAKLKRGAMPPTVSMDELKALKLSN